MSSDDATRPAVRPRLDVWAHAPRRRAMACAVVAAVAVLSLGAASPDEVFKRLGLTRSGSVLTLASAEQALHEAVRSLRAAKAKVAGEAAKRKQAEAKMDGLIRQFDADQAALLRAEQGLAKHPDDNRFIGEHNSDLTQVQMDRMKVAEQIEVLDKIAGTRTGYVTAVLDAGEVADASAHAYDAPAADAALAPALAQFNLTAKPKVRLGPTATFTDDLAFVAAAKKEVVSDAIPVTMAAEVPHVEVLLNGRVVKTMVWDSGASSVMLSAATAFDLGITPKADDPEAEFTIADGSRVKARIVTLDSIRIGAFTVPDVECILLPKGQAGADLLGGSFQHRFKARLDADAGTLQLTPIDTSITTTAAPKPAAAPVAQRPPRATPADARTVDLLAGVDPATQASVRGGWSFRDGRLVSTDARSNAFDLNYRPPTEYDYSVTFTRLSGDDGLDLTFYAGGRQPCWSMGSWGNTVCGFGEVAGKERDANPTTVRDHPLRNGQTYTCTLKVRVDEVSAYLDDVLVSRWKTDYADMDQVAELHRPDSIGFSSWASVYAISKVQVTTISGRGRRLDASDPIDQRLLASATSVTKDGDVRHLKLYADGHFEAAGWNRFDCRWYLHGRTVIFTWGRYVDTCELSADRTSYQGHNQDGDPIRGTIISGTLAPPPRLGTPK